MTKQNPELLETRATCLLKVRIQNSPGSFYPILKRNDPGKQFDGYWELPGGKAEGLDAYVIDPYAPEARKAMQRELLEETGFNIPDEKLLPFGEDELYSVNRSRLFPNTGFGLRNHLLYSANITQTIPYLPEIQFSNEHSAAFWVPWGPGLLTMSDKLFINDTYRPTIISGKHGLPTESFNVQQLALAKKGELYLQDAYPQMGFQLTRLSSTILNRHFLAQEFVIWEKQQNS